jgi:hypothetical protein
MKINIIPSVLLILALSPVAQAVSPASDGGYPGGNTAEGQSALLTLTTGGYNTAVGWFSLRSRGANRSERFSKEMRRHVGQRVPHAERGQS